ncbi:E3 ubiquitin-protein ligase MIB2, partial [Biomphalaria pfeifferi]
LQEINDWEQGNESTYRTQAGVLWVEGAGYTYRLGHNGKVDLEYVKPASGGFYYKTHLPVL